MYNLFPGLAEKNYIQHRLSSRPIALNETLGDYMSEIGMSLNSVWTCIVCIQQ